MKKKKSGWFYVGMVLLFIIKIPYYLVKGIYLLIKKITKKFETENVKKKRKSIGAIYGKFKILESKEGDFGEWEKSVLGSDSLIGVILGARGSGKSAFGIKFLENVYSKTKKRCYAMGFKKDELPSWINVVENISEIKNDSFILIDEGGILFNSRKSMSSGNKLLSELILISRHKNLSILFISQNSSNLEVNVFRQADFLILKKSSLLQKDFERKIVQKTYDSVKDDFKKFKDDKGLAYIYGENFKGFVSNPLPSFWGEKISKGFR